MDIFSQSQQLLSNIDSNVSKALTALESGDVATLQSLAFETASMEVEFEVMTRPLNVDWVCMN